MKGSHVVLLVLAVLMLGVGLGVGGTLLITRQTPEQTPAPQSAISSEEIIYIVKQHEKDRDMFIPVEGHWAAEYIGKGVWYVPVYVVPYEDNYPAYLQENAELSRKFRYYIYGLHLWRYFERSGDMEEVRYSDMTEILNECPRLAEVMNISPE